MIPTYAGQTIGADTTAATTRGSQKGESTAAPVASDRQRQRKSKRRKKFRRRRRRVAEGEKKKKKEDGLDESEEERERREQLKPKTWRPDLACSEAIRDASDFLAANERLEGSRNVQLSQPPGNLFMWEPPESGCGLGLVVRDENGAFRAARAVNIGNLVHPLVAEGMAAREGILFAQELGFTRIQLEGDSQQIVNLIQRKEDSNSSVGVIISVVNKLRSDFEELKVSFVRRCGNFMAHIVAKNTAKGSGIRTWKFYPPLTFSSSS